MPEPSLTRLVVIERGNAILLVRVYSDQDDHLLFSVAVAVCFGASCTRQSATITLSRLNATTG